MTKLPKKKNPKRNNQQLDLITLQRLACVEYSDFLMQFYQSNLSLKFPLYVFNNHTQ